jgi:hypothetical protein
MNRNFKFLQILSEGIVTGNFPPPAMTAHAHGARAPATTACVATTDVRSTRAPVGRIRSTPVCRSLGPLPDPRSMPPCRSAPSPYKNTVIFAQTQGGTDANPANIGFNRA